MTTEPQGCIDPYTGQVDACQPDPCSSDGVTTLYHVMPCGPENPPMTVWCLDRPEHPACTAVVGVAPAPPVLPDTGLSNVAGAGLAGAVMLALGWALLKLADL